jgi:hypothetical protein
MDADPAHVRNTFSPIHSLGAAIDRRRTGTPGRLFSGQVDRISFGSNQYQWHQQGIGGHADPDGPPSRSTAAGGAQAVYQIPEASITGLRGRVGR